jgi:hypothetical protein
MNKSEIDRLRIIERDLTEALIMSMSEDKKLLKVSQDLREWIYELLS